MRFTNRYFMQIAAMNATHLGYPHQDHFILEF